MSKEQSEQLYKEIMGSYPTGVTIVTTMDGDDKPVGLTVNSFSSVSLEPLIISWCIDKKSGSIDTFKKAEKFAVNILAGDQEEACFAFASSKETDRFGKVNWGLSSDNLPVLKDVFAVLECRKMEEIDAGDHVILLGNVFNLEKNNTEPMLYYRRKVGFASESMTRS